MVSFAGVDGCRGGWLMVRLEGRTGAGMVVQATRWAGLPGADLIAVDMPIGLPASGGRTCDRLARSLLGPRRSSVFIGLRRPLLDFDDYPVANAWAKSDGAGLSKQAWNLLPRIRELDSAIEPADQERIRETHPELVFRRLRGQPLADSKRTEAGRRCRRRLLEAAGFSRLDDWLVALDRRQAAADDLFDACALAWAAGKMIEGEATRLPAEPLHDERGLRMEIWY